MSSFLATPARYRVIESSDQVMGISPDLSTRFRWRAERRARSLNRNRLIHSYHWRAKRRGSRWLVVPYQNYLVPLS